MRHVHHCVTGGTSQWQGHVPTGSDCRTSERMWPSTRQALRSCSPGSAPLPPLLPLPAPACCPSTPTMCWPACWCMSWSTPSSCTGSSPSAQATLHTLQALSCSASDLHCYTMKLLCSAGQKAFVCLGLVEGCKYGLSDVCIMHYISKGRLTERFVNRD